MSDNVEYLLDRNGNPSGMVHVHPGAGRMMVPLVSIPEGHQVPQAPDTRQEELARLKRIKAEREAAVDADQEIARLRAELGEPDPNATDAEEPANDGLTPIPAP